jgi:hypothetical protein
LPESDFQFVIAEIAVALSGFAALVTVISGRLGSGEPGARREAQQLRAMLLTSLVTGFMALFPYVPLHAGISPEVSWRIASAAYLLAWGLMMALNASRVGRLARTDGSTGIRRFPASFWVNQAIQVGVISSLLAGAAGMWAKAVDTAYLGALLACLYVSGSIFFSLFASLVSGRRTGSTKLSG